MGWASGARLAEELWDAIREDIPPVGRQRVALKIIGHFEFNDCDNIDEAETLLADADPQMDLEFDPVTVEPGEDNYEHRSRPLRPRTGPAEYPRKKS